jgi:hypothetical protein
MFDDGIENDFEHAHQTGLTRGFDLGWSYKGRFDRAILREHVEQLDEELEHEQIKHFNLAIEILTKHKNNREFITDV